MVTSLMVARTLARAWSKLNEAWFPAGVGDPDLALVQVTDELPIANAVAVARPAESLKRKEAESMAGWWSRAIAVVHCGPPVGRDRGRHGKI